MKLRVGAATLPKRGNSPEENEDAFAPLVTEGLQSVPFRCAVADGATEASYSGLWAKLLAEHFCTVEPDRFQADLPSLRENWKATTGSKPLPWYAEQKLEKGAFATLLGVQITEGEFPFLRWRAISAGDSVLFHVRAFEGVAKFPVRASGDFQNHPILFATSASTEEVNGKPICQFSEGILESGDRLYLATDKVAEWIIHGLENDTKPFLQLDQVVRTENSFASLVESLTALNQIKNDDYTLLWVEAHSEGI
jgi:serine/threonine protein phosphatase PrpC